jgi:hypothetical protein
VTLVPVSAEDPVIVTTVPVVETWLTVAPPLDNVVVVLAATELPKSRILLFPVSLIQRVPSGEKDGLVT